MRFSLYFYFCFIFYTTLNCNSFAGLILGKRRDKSPDTLFSFALWDTLLLNTECLFIYLLYYFICHVAKKEKRAQHSITIYGHFKRCFFSQFGTIWKLSSLQFQVLQEQYKYSSFLNLKTELLNIKTELYKGLG